MANDDECLSCKLSNFGNFHSKIAELKGGELYVLEESIRQKKVLPCQPMASLDSGFALWKAVYNSIEKDVLIEELKSDEILVMPSIIYFSWQSFFDLKASAFLALTAHYRSAIQLLRPILENILVGKYFWEKVRHANDDNKCKKEYEDFLNWSEQDDHKVDFNISLQYLNSKHIINSEEQKRIKELWDKLHKYIHSYMFRWDKGDNPEIVCYNEGSFNEWFDLYQNLLSYLIEMLCHYFPEAVRTQNGRDALVELSGLASLEKNCEIGITLIKSKYFRKFLSQISPDGNLPQETGLDNSLPGLPDQDETSKT